MNSVVDLLCCGAGLHHHGCDVQDLSCQLQTEVRINPGGKSSAWDNLTKTTVPTSQTTLMPSMSSADRVLICDVPFRNRSDSDIPE